MKKIFVLLFPLTAFAQNDLTKFVDPFIGTGGHGHTYPGATTPFGTVQLSPDTRIDGSWDGCSGYYYTDTLIYGFSHTHLSGTGCSDLGDILLMPGNGTDQFAPEKYASTFNKTSEKAKPGFYAVSLTKDLIGVELTATARCGFHEYSFLSKQNPHVLLDLTSHDETLEAWIKVETKTRIIGMRRSRAWAKNQVVFFVMELDREFETIFLADGKQLAVGDSVNENDLKASIHFSFSDFEKEMPLKIKLGLSGVDAPGAKKNLTTEIGIKSFSTISHEADSVWNQSLKKIEVFGRTESDKRIFYTALYHTMLAPNIWSDVDGRYRGRDGKIHVADGFKYYSVFSLWDTYRAAHPLYTIIERERDLDFIKTFLAQYDQAGLLPVWELCGNETECMIGYHAVPVIVDAYVNGIKDFDTKKAFEAMKKSAESRNRFGLGAFMDKRFIEVEDESESVSKTLEYAYDDFCISKFADRLKYDSSGYFFTRSENWINLFNPRTGFMQPRSNGGWLPGFDPKQVNNHFTEANSWQYTFAVQQNIFDLSKRMGGDALFEQKLDSLFSTASKTTGREQADISGLIGQYAHGNEPSHHIAYLYNYIGKCWKTQERVHQICTTLYHDAPDGLCGNEDCGQMSAWYVFSALGFYPVCPGSGQYEIGTPLFDSAVIHGEANSEFIIVAHRKSAGDFYIDRALLNGKNMTNPQIGYCFPAHGGKIEFEMASIPNKNFATDGLYFPGNILWESLSDPLPVINAPHKTFIDSLPIRIESLSDHKNILFSVRKSENNSGDFVPYTGPFWIHETDTILAKSGDTSSTFSRKVTRAIFHKIPPYKVTLKNPCNPQYTAGGSSALIDGIHGDLQWRKGDWMGIQGNDFEAVIDLRKMDSVHSITATFLSDTRSWIFLPGGVEFWTSSDSVHWTMISGQSVFADPHNEKVRVEQYSFGTKIIARFIMIKAKNFGKLPEWHPGAGDDAFIFIDEVEVK